MKWNWFDVVLDLTGYVVVALVLYAMMVVVGGDGVANKPLRPGWASLIVVTDTMRRCPQPAETPEGGR